MLSSLQKSTAWISSCFYTFTSPCKAHCHHQVWCHPTAAVRPTLCAAENPRAQHSAAAKAFCWHLLKAREREISLCLPPFIAAHQETNIDSTLLVCLRDVQVRWARQTPSAFLAFCIMHVPFVPSHFSLQHSCCPISPLYKRPTGNSILLCFSPVFSHLPLNCMSLIVLGTKADDGCPWASNEGVLSARQLWGRSSVFDGCWDKFPLTSFLPLPWFHSDSWAAADSLSLCVNWVGNKCVKSLPHGRNPASQECQLFVNCLPLHLLALSSHSVIACPMFSLDLQAKVCFQGLLLSSVLLNADELVPFLIFGSKGFHRWSVHKGTQCAQQGLHMRSGLTWTGPSWATLGTLAKLLLDWKLTKLDENGRGIASSPQNTFKMHRYHMKKYFVMRILSYIR